MLPLNARQGADAAGVVKCRAIECRTGGADEGGGCAVKVVKAGRRIIKTLRSIETRISEIINVAIGNYERAGIIASGRSAYLGGDLCRRIIDRERGSLDTIRGIVVLLGRCLGENQIAVIVDRVRGVVCSLKAGIQKLADVAVRGGARLDRRAVVFI